MMSHSFRFFNPLVDTIILVALLCLGTFFFLEQRWDQIVSNYSFLEDNNAQSKYKLTTSHLMLEEKIAGNLAIRPDVLFNLINQAEKHANSLLNDAHSSLDSKMVEQIRQLKDSIDTFRTLTIERLDNPSTKVFDEASSREFAKLFTSIVATHDNIDELLQHQLAQDKTFQQKIFFVLVAGFTFLFSIVVYFAYRRGAKNKFMESVLYDLAMEMGGVSGSEFHTKITGYLANTFKVKFAVIGELDRVETSLKIIATNDEALAGYWTVLPLANTPCEKVVKTRQSLFSSNVTTQFPNAPFLAEKKIVSYVGVPLKDKAGRAIGLVALMHTKPLKNRRLVESLVAICAERISAEVDRKDLEDDRDRIFEFAPDLICTGSIDGGKFKQVNQRVVKLLGYKPDELRAKSFLEFIHPQDKERAGNELAALREGEKSHFTEHRFRCKDGSYKWMAWTVQAYINEGVFYAVGRDVSLRKMLEKEKEKALAELGERMKELRCLHDVSSIASQPGKTLQEVMQELASYLPLGMQSPTTACARIVLDNVHYTSYEEHGGHPFMETPWFVEADIISATKVVGKVQIFYFFDNTIRGNTSPPRDTREILKAVANQIGIVVDRKKAEAILQAEKEKAVKATELKNKFVSLVAHDIKSPFTGILGLLQVLSQDKKNPLQDHQKKIITNLIKSGKQLVSMTDELLEITRLESGTLVPRCSFIDAYEVCVKAMSGVSYLAKQKGIELVNMINPSMRVYADRVLLEEVLNNLVGNAVKFCKSGDRITIVADENEKSTIIVKDTGIGISPAMLTGLFNHEIKTSTPGTNRETGTGLGLPLSSDIVKAHGGTLTAESQVGVGSSFFVKLPHIAPKILVVDDEESFRVEQKYILGTIGMEVYEANSGEHALHVMENIKPHMIIADIRMQGMSGLDLLKEIKGSTHTKHIPVVIVSADHGRDLREELFRLGAYEFIRKPVNHDVFLPRINRFFLGTSAGLSGNA